MTPAERKKAEYWKHRDRYIARARRHRLMTRYGITVEQREQMELDQQGLCALCGGPPTTVKGLHVDHCHETGRVRGLLCHHCNGALGRLGDNEAGLLRALEYVRGAA